MSKITWLHISDLHFTPARQWDENIVLRALLIDIREQIKSAGLRPDFCAVSGDIAFQAAPEEYALARTFFDELLSVTELTKGKLFVVPGNHDIDRKRISRGGETIAMSLDSREAVTQILTDREDRLLLFRKLESYAAFVKEYFEGHALFDDEHFYFVRHLELPVGRLAVLGLNSAWLAMGDEDHGNLALGEYQVRQALEDSKEADLRVALMHHPFEWLHEFDRNDCEPLILQECQIVLHGHLHRSGVLSLAVPDAQAMVIAAGACYQSRNYPNSYNIVQLDVEKRKGAVHLRRYSDERGGFWTRDVMTYRNVQDGKFEFNLPWGHGPATTKPRRETRRIVKTRSPDPKLLEHTYLRRVMTVANALPLAVIDPRAVERTRQATMDLLSVYVALDTQTQGAAEKGEKKGRPRLRGSLPRLDEEGSEEARPLSALEAVARENRLVLLGDPGSGKSTFANFLAMCLAGERLEGGGKWLARLEHGWVAGALLPLKITLREFAASKHCNGKAAGLLRFVNESLAAESISEYAPHLREHLLQGRVLVILDGLDEVADPGERKSVQDAVADFRKTYGHPGNRYLVTCRSYAYEDMALHLDGFIAHTLAPFTQDQIDAFIDCWYREVCRLGWKSLTEAQDLTQRLQAAARRPDLVPLARNPLQLTMMASLHFAWGRLPDDRAQLYQEMVRLLLVRWQEARLGEDVGVTSLISPTDLESALERVAFTAHRTQEKPEGPADILEAQLRHVFRASLDGSWDKAGAVLAYVKERAGLLLEKTQGIYTFPHRSYQEYLAGAYLARERDFPDQSARLVCENYMQWREVILWAVGTMARLKRIVHTAVDVASALCSEGICDRDITDAEWRSAALAGEALLEIGLKEVKARKRHEEVLKRVQGWLKALLERGTLMPGERARAGITLSYLGDPRFDPDMCYLPKDETLGFVKIPRGPFIMGEEEGKDEVKLDVYYIGRFLVTVAQYQGFLTGGGYGMERYWKEALSAKIWKEGRVQGPYDKQPRDRPVDYVEPFTLQNHPVVGITWYEALAYCRWLTDKLKERETLPGDLAAALRKGWIVRLPSETEWEKAARDTDGRIYPWGNEPDPDRANYSETGIGATSAVGSFPKGASPYGLLDMSGNVWEWCLTKWRDDYKSKKEDNSLDGNEPRSLRGGSFVSSALLVRCASRFGLDPDYGGRRVGFRVVLAPAKPSVL